MRPVARGRPSPYPPRPRAAGPRLRLPDGQPASCALAFRPGRVAACLVQRRCATVRLVQAPVSRPRRCARFDHGRHPENARSGLSRPHGSGDDARTHRLVPFFHRIQGNRRRHRNRPHRRAAAPAIGSHHAFATSIFVHPVRRRPVMTMSTIDRTDYSPRWRSTRCFTSSPSIRPGKSQWPATTSSRSPAAMSRRG